MRRCLQICPHCPPGTLERYSSNPDGSKKQISIREGRFCTGCYRYCLNCVKCWLGNRDTEIMPFEEFLFHVDQSHMFEAFTLQTDFNKPIWDFKLGRHFTVAQQAMRLVAKEYDGWDRNYPTRPLIPYFLCDLIHNHGATMTDVPRISELLNCWTSGPIDDEDTLVLTDEQAETLINAGWKVSEHSRHFSGQSTQPLFLAI